MPETRDESRAQIRMLQDRIQYDPVTGKLFWKEARPEHFSREADCLSFNARHAGNEIGKGRRGYTSIGIQGKFYSAHRVAWIIYHGRWPTGVIDHRNGKTEDNRICNLRDVSQSENMRNVKRTADNTSGVTGVYLNKRRCRWVAKITHKKKTHHLGYYDKFEDAVAARRKAERELGFGPIHGRNQ